MGKTNFDDIELGVAGIEADEINSEAATVGQVLTADGNGGVGWQTHGFVSLTVNDMITVEEGGDVAWTALGLAAAGVPTEATAVLLGVHLQDTVSTAVIYFRPYGSDWPTSLTKAISMKAASTEEVEEIKIVPCAAGKVEYNVNASGADTAWYFINLLGYWL